MEGGQDIETEEDEEERVETGGFRGSGCRDRYNSGGFEVEVSVSVCVGVGVVCES